MDCLFNRFYVLAEDHVSKLDLPGSRLNLADMCQRDEQGNGQGTDYQTENQCFYGRLVPQNRFHDSIFGCAFLSTDWQ